MSRLIRSLIGGFILVAAASVSRAADHPFLPLAEGKSKADFTGEQWNDQWQDSPSPIAAQLTLTKLAEFPQGAVVEVRTTVTGKPKHPRDFPVSDWLITPEGAISRVDAGEKGERLEEWKKQKAVPAPNQDALLFPPFDETGSFRVVEPSPGENKLVSAVDQWRWSAGSSRTRITSDGRSSVRYLRSDDTGRYFMIAWQRGVGIVEIASSEAEGKDGWILHRTVPPARPLAGKDPDIGVLFSLLPSEFIPASDVFKDLASPTVRARLADAKTAPQIKAACDSVNAESWDCKRANGYLKLTSKGGGEGDTLEAALWKRQDGSRLLGIQLQHWTAGPTYTVAVRLVELRDGHFRWVTDTQWRLPELEDFYTAGEAETMTPAGHLQGAWGLPIEGTTITIRPGNEEGADMTPEAVKSEETYFFEMLWDGKTFRRIRLPRIIPPTPAEPKEWAFQSVDSEAPIGSCALFLKRQGNQLTGELRQSLPKAQSFPVKGMLDSDGAIAFSISYGTETKSAGETQLKSKAATPGDWNALELTSDLATDQTVHFHTVPTAPSAAPLPRYQWISEKAADGETEMNSLRFDVPAGAHAADWKTINGAVAAAVKTAGQAWLEKQTKASHATPPTPSPGSPSHASIRSEVDSICPDTVSISISTVWGSKEAELAADRATLNYDLKTHRLLKLSDLFEPKSEWNKGLAAALNALLVKSGDYEAGQTPITPETAQGLNWTFALAGGLDFHLAESELGDKSHARILTTPLNILQDIGHIQPHSAIDVNR